MVTQSKFKCAGIMLAVAASASGQTTPGETEPGSATPEEVIVTGIRQSLEAGVEIKRDSSQFVDSIVAEDIGKLPDNNIAESLQRVSGVQIRRALGEGTSVSIRGLRQNRIEVNGRTLVSPYGRGPGMPTDSDYNPLSLYPSELINRLEVTKLLSADQSDGSLGGTVNIITRRPLDHSGPVFAASIEGLYSDLAEETGHGASALYSNTFNDDTFGVLVNLVYSDKPIREDSFNSFAGWLPLTTAFDPNADGTPDNDPNNDGLPGEYIADLRYQVLEEDRERIGANIALQWQPADNLEFYLDGLLSNGEATRRRNWFAVALSTNGADYLNYTFSPNEALVAGTVNRPIQGNDERLDLESNSWSSALGAKWESGPLTLAAELDVSAAQLDYNQTYVRTQSLANHVVSFDFRGGDVPQMTLPAGLNVLDPAVYRYSNFFDNRFEYEANETAARLDLTYAVNAGAFDSIQVGGKWTELETDVISTYSQLTSNVTLPSRSSSLYEAVNFSGLLAGQAPFAASYLAGNPFGTGASFACEAIILTCTPRVFDPTASYEIDEQTSAGYVRANFDGDLGSVPFSGNLGVRYTETQRDATSALRRADGTFQPLTSQPAFHDWLPSAVVKFDLTDEVILRVGAGKVVGLPDSVDLSPGLLLNRIVNTGTGGNPELEPFRATQYDASIEWYFADGAALTGGLFYKDVGSFLSTRTTFETVPGEAGQFLVTRRVNGQGGKIQGVEILYQQPFTFLPAPFDGFGILANYSYIDSETPFVNRRTGEGLPIEGLSKNNFNIVGYYEMAGFGARLAYNYRDEYLDSITAGGEGSFFEPYSTLDASVRYGFDHWTVSLEAANLTDEEQRRYTGSKEATALYALQGRRFSFGVSAKF